MQTIRSFISIPIPAGITGTAIKLVKKLKELDDGVRWVPLDNFHLTIKHLGDVDNIEIHDVSKIVRSVTDLIRPFELDFVGVGVMPNPQKPRSVYAGIEDPTGRLVEMVGELEKKLAKEMGFKQEPRDYKPHLILGRTRSNSRRVAPELVEALDQYSDLDFGKMVVDEVDLMGSFLDKGGPSYQVMDTIELPD